MGGFAALGGLLVVPVGAVGSFKPGVNPFRAVGGLVGCVRSRWLGARAHFVFQGLSCFGILVYDCYLMGGLLMASVGTMGSFWPGVAPFRTVGVIVRCVQSRELGASSVVYPAGTLQ